MQNYKASCALVLAAEKWDDKAWNKLKSLGVGQFLDPAKIYSIFAGSKNWKWKSKKNTEGV